MNFISDIAPLPTPSLPPLYSEYSIQGCALLLILLYPRYIIDSQLFCRRRPFLASFLPSFGRFGECNCQLALWDCGEQLAISSSLYVMLQKVDSVGGEWGRVREGTEREIHQFRHNSCYSKSVLSGNWSAFHVSCQ